MMSDDEALEALKDHLAKGVEEMKAVRDFALGFHAGNHRMKRGEKAALLKALAAVRKETVDARDFLTKKWPFPPKPQFDLLLSHFARPDAALARSATPSEVR